MAKREVFNDQSRMLIRNVLEYFEKKKQETPGYFSALKCASEALQISQRTIARIKNEEDNIAERAIQRKAPKSSDMDEAVKTEIKKVVYNMIAKRECVTRKKICEELRNKNIIVISESTLSKVLANLGFKYKIDNGRRALVNGENKCKEN